MLEISVLVTMIAVQAFLLLLAYSKKASWLFLFAGISGMATIVTLVNDNAEIQYVTSGIVVTLASGGFFILIPTMLTIIAFMGLIALK